MEHILKLQWTGIPFWCQFNYWNATPLILRWVPSFTLQENCAKNVLDLCQNNQTLKADSVCSVKLNNLWHLHLFKPTSPCHLRIVLRQVLTPSSPFISLFYWVLLGSIVNLIYQSLQIFWFNRIVLSLHNYELGIFTETLLDEWTIHVRSVWWYLCVMPCPKQLNPWELWLIADSGFKGRFNEKWLSRI